MPSEARLIKYISTYTCNTIKKTAAKPPAERSEANKVPSEARLIKYISTYTCNKTPTFLWFDAELAAGDYRSRKSITAGGFQPGVNSRFRYLLKNEYNSRCASGTSSATSRLSNHNVPPGSSENPYGEARSAEFDWTGGPGGTGWTGWTCWTDGTVPKSVL